MVLKPIKGYEGIYSISNQGKVWSHKRKGRPKGRWIKQQHDIKSRRTVCLYKDRKMKSFYIHRLVAEAFIPNPEKRSQVNHIDGNKLNNKMENLEWVNQDEHTIHTNGLRTKRHYNMKYGRNKILHRIRNQYAHPIEGYEGYFVDQNGRVYQRTDTRTRELTQTMTIKGYKVVNLNNGGQKTYLSHRLVAEHHVDNPDPEKLTDVHHLDNNRANNSYDNLMWVSHVANMRLISQKEPVSRDNICAYSGVVTE